MTGSPEVYGKYTLGSGAILRDPNSVWSGLANAQVISDYETSMRRDLAKSGIKVSSLSDWSIMDVGTGRQALAFLSMGARHVSHYDISAENVQRVRTHIDTFGLTKRLDTRCCDLVETDLGRDRFDFVYLNGIVQHFSNVGVGLSNCVRAMKPDGLLWLYFYRSGTFDNFVLYMLRTLATGSNVVKDESAMRDYYIAARLFFSGDARDNYLTSIFMDGVFTRYARLYTPMAYLAFAEACGLAATSSSGLDPIGRGVDHHFARAASVVTLRKVRSVGDADLRDAAKILAPEVEIDQLDPGLYDDPEILAAVNSYRRLEAALNARTVPPATRMFVVLRLFAVLVSTRAAEYDPMRRHSDLNAALSTMLDLIQGEYDVR